MKILFITHYFAPDSGAAANRLTRLAKMLQNNGHQVSVLTTMPHYPTGNIPDAYHGKFSKVETIDDVRVVHIWLWASQSKRTFMRLISQVSFMLALMLRGIFEQKPDVIFIENQPIFTGFAGWFISKIKRTPYVLNISDYWPEYLLIAGLATEKSITYRVFKQLAILTQRDAAQIAVMWDGLVDGVKNRLKNPPTTTLIYNATDLETFYPDKNGQLFREKYNLGDMPIVSFIGTLGAHIDLETMLVVAKRLAEANVTVLFVGTGTQKPDLDSALSQPEYNHCHSIEWIDYSEVPDFWAVSTVNYWAMHDNPLDKLRFQAKLFEALASGTPTVIAIADGLMSELLSQANAGITVQPYDKDALYQNIQHLLNANDERENLSKNARAYADANFDPTITTDRYEHLLITASNKKY